MDGETQGSVAEWCARHYPGEDARKRFLNLLEEVTELGCVLGIPEEEMVRVIGITVAKSDDPVGDPVAIAKEVGDVELSVWNLADGLGLETQACLDEVMAHNRTRTEEESAARSARKTALGLR